MLNEGDFAVHSRLRSVLDAYVYDISRGAATPTITLSATGGATASAARSCQCLEAH